MCVPLSVLDDAQNFVFSHDEILVAVQLDLLPRILTEQYGVTSLDIEGGQRAVVLDLTFADGEDLPLLRLFLGGVGNRGC